MKFGKKYLWAAILAILLFLAGAAYLKLNDAAAIVGWQIVSLDRLNKHQAAALNYYLKAAETYNLRKEEMGDPKFVAEVRRAALDKLIEDAIILKELKSAAKGEFEAIAENKVKSVIGERDVTEEAAALYNLSPEEFKTEVLLPQAYREILEGRMFLEGASFSDWLHDARRKTRVVVTVDGFSWDGNRVIITSGR